MSHCPGGTLEDFVEDAIMCPTPELVAKIVAVLEPCREEIERSIDNHLDNADERSWRQDRNDMWELYVESNPERKAKIDAILKATP